MGTKKRTHKDFGYCHLYGDILLPQRVYQATHTGFIVVKL